MTPDSKAKLAMTVAGKDGELQEVLLLIVAPDVRWHQGLGEILWQLLPNLNIVLQYN